MTNTLRLASASLLIAYAASGSHVHAQTGPTVTVLLNLTGPNGLYPFGALAYGNNGTLYGATFAGGKYGYGDIFQLTQGFPGGPWTPTILFNFQDPATDGANPYGGLLVAFNGAIYGTTTRGGAYGLGTAFELEPPEQPDGAWTESLLCSFGSDPGDGVYPYSGLVMDFDGNLYGTTPLGGAFGLGTVYELVASFGEGPYEETVLYSFAGGADVANPYATLTFGPDGTLYGTAPYGGGVDAGGVFALTPQFFGDWDESVLCAFPGATSSGNPYGGVYLGVNGGLYGATTNGGTTGAGTIYRCAQVPHSSAWDSVAIYNMPSYASPYGTPVGDVTGALYDTTPGAHGSQENNGIIFKLSPPTKEGGAWVETTLYAFPGSNGSGPRAGLTWGPGGALFGTTVGLGQAGTGTVYQLTF